jgi:hypothetical protein
VYLVILFLAGKKNFKQVTRKRVTLNALKNPKVFKLLFYFLLIQNNSVISLVVQRNVSVPLQEPKSNDIEPEKDDVSEGEIPVGPRKSKKGEKEVMLNTQPRKYHACTTQTHKRITCEL